MVTLPHFYYLLLKPNQERFNELNFPLVSDLNQTIINKYKLLTNDTFSFSDLFIIDKERIIQYYTVNNLLCDRSINQLLRILRSIQYIKQKPGQACPVG